MALQASPHSASRAKVDSNPRSHTAFTPTTRKVILEAISKGRYPSAAANAAGIHYVTLKRWLEEGYQHQEMRLEGFKLDARGKTFADFYVAFMKAEADHEGRMLDKVEEIGESEHQWAAFMTMLERRYPDRWKKREQTEVVGVGGGEVRIQVDNTPSQLREVLEVLVESGALTGLLRNAGISPPEFGSVIDAEADEIHPARSDAEAAGGDAPPGP